jgi:glycosyltransferase involved in cell wall biosynthesis
MSNVYEVTNDCQHDLNYLMANNNKPLISVVTVVFNGKDFLEETILSVINQTYENVEYIIIDGGSEDGTLDIIKKYEDKISYWISQPDNGIYDAMNKGISLVSGAWINFMNAGDVFHSNMTLEEVSPKLIADLVYGNHAIYENNLNIYSIFNVKNYDDKRNIPFCHQSSFVKSSVLRENLFDLTYKIAADYDQYLRIKYAGHSLLWVPIVVAKVLHGGVSSRSRLVVIREYYRACKKYRYIYSLLWCIFRLIKYFFSGR